ncbi:MAG: hypothetical protein WAO00_06400 [Chthoniobacterales bacterium]
METNACSTPPILNAEFTMLSRLAITVRNYRRALVSLRQRLFRRTRGSKRAALAQHRLVPATERVDYRPSVSAGQEVSPDHAEFVRTQSQLMQTMLKAMILASGWKDNGRPGGPV